MSKAIFSAFIYIIIIISFIFNDNQENVGYKLYMDDIESKYISLYNDSVNPEIKHVNVEKVIDKNQHVYHVTAYNATEESLPSNPVRVAPEIGTQYKNVKAIIKGN